MVVFYLNYFCYCEDQTEIKSDEIRMRLLLEKSRKEI